MPVKLSTYSNFSVTVARVYYKAITNRNLFALLDIIAFVLKEQVAVAVEAFDGKHRGRLQGGGQYYAHQGVEANELVRPFMPGSDKPSALTKVGKALRVEALAAHAIKLLLNVSPTTPAPRASLCRRLPLRQRRWFLRWRWLRRLLLLLLLRRRRQRRWHWHRRRFPERHSEGGGVCPPGFCSSRSASCKAGAGGARVSSSW
jgi:hypothetical protein